MKITEMASLRVIETLYMSELTQPRQVRFPRRKNKRERARWRRDPRNWDEGGDLNIVRVNENLLMMHPITAMKFRDLLRTVSD